MPDSSQSQSAPGFLQGTKQSLADGTMSVINDAHALVTADNAPKAALVVALNTALAVVAPLPYAVAGVFSVSRAMLFGKK